MILRESSYCTCYNVGNRDFIDMACFADYFRSLRDEQECNNIIKVYVGKEPGFGNEEANHTLLFNENEILQHVNVLTQLIPNLRFSVTAGKLPIFGEKHDCYVISLDINGKKIIHKFVLTWVRYLYEFPYNIILKEAYRLQNYDKPFNKYSIFNLFMLCSTAFPEMPGIGHSFNHSGYFLSNKTIKERLGMCTDLNDIYTPVSYEAYDTYSLKFSREIPYHDTDYWDDRDNFIKRIPHYKKVLDFLT